MVILPIYCWLWHPGKWILEHYNIRHSKLIDFIFPISRCVMQHEKEMASSIMAASLSLGLAMGSMLSMIFVQML